METILESRGEPIHVTSYLGICKAELNTYLARLIEVHGPASVLHEAMNYSLLNDGKRLRPALCMAMAEAFGVARKSVLPAAAAIEMIHSYSLVHDDLPCMDDDDLRRGKATNHKVFGEAMALLAGDALLTQAFVVLSQPLSDVPPARQLRMLGILSSRSGADGMVGGQALDIQMTGKNGTIQHLEYIHLHKTARLMQASIEIGALFSDISEQQFEAVSKYGEALGLAFQMIDDVLDIVGDEAQIGKTPGKDEETGKLTYPALIGVDATRRLAKETIAQGEAALAQVQVSSCHLADLQYMILERIN